MEFKKINSQGKKNILSLSLFSLPSDFWLLCCTEEYPCLSPGLINLEKTWVGGENLKTRETRSAELAQLISHEQRFTHSSTNRTDVREACLEVLRNYHKFELVCKHLFPYFTENCNFSSQDGTRPKGCCTDPPRVQGGQGLTLAL